jgi:hypothetical protein
MMKCARTSLAVRRAKSNIQALLPAADPYISKMVSDVKIEKIYEKPPSRNVLTSRRLVRRLFPASIAAL